jgi:hypothetical protein
MSALNNSALIGASGSTGYQISRSVRLRSSASAYFNRTFGSGGNTNTWTWSGWVKRGALGGGNLFNTAAPVGANTLLAQFAFSNDSLDFLQFTGGVSYTRLITTSVFRDPSAWYHIVLRYDDTQATAANRVRLYVNGVQITAFSTASYPTQNFSGFVNSAQQHIIGYYAGSGGGNFFDGYLTEINFIGGQSLDPSSFGSINATTGVWSPIKYAGTYGTNGFYLNFSDNSAATAAAIGKDYSGNGNNWTPNNISVAAGVTYDSMLDVPTQWADGGNGRGNYSTLNPLAMYGTNAVISNASLTSTATGSANDRGWPSTIAAPGSGKWYAEFTFTTTDAGNNGGCGIMLENGTGAPGESATTVSWRDAGTLRQNATGTSYGTALSAGDIVMLAYDASLGRVWFGRNGTWFASGDPATNANPSATGITTTGRFATYHFGVAATIAANFGQRPFSYTPPTGFKALNTLNLPTPTILKGNQYFDATLYTANASSQTISSLQFQPDFLWIKSRSGAYSNILQNSVTGAPNELFSNLTNAEFTATDRVLSFTSNGWTMGADAAYGVNAPNGATQVAWSWKANGTPAVTNTAGTITSTVSVGATQGFSVVTYTGNGVTGATVGHGLGVVPEFIIWKRRDATSNWISYNKTSGNGFSLYLDLTNANTASSYLNSTNPNSSVITMATNTDNNGNGGTYVAYCFASVAGYSAFGSYTGNGSADGTFVFTGFRPRYVMIKGSSFVSNWFVIDTSRSPVNVSLDALRPNLSGAEVNSPTTTYSIDILSNGFKLRSSAADANTNGATFIYACFAENPFKNALAR